MGLDHLNLRVRDVEACTAFYERWLGFRVDRVHDEHDVFMRDDRGFLLALCPAGDGWSPLPPGAHLGTRLPDAEAVQARREQMAVEGFETSEVTVEDGYVSFRCHDPDGTEVEVYWEG